MTDKGVVIISTKSKEDEDRMNNKASQSFAICLCTVGLYINHFSLIVF